MKLCTKCLETKPLSEFHKSAKNSQGVQPWCKPCSCADSRQRYHKPGVKEAHARSAAANRERVKLQVVEYLLTHPCVDCGEDDPVVLDFDHVHGKKLGQVGHMASHAASWAKIEAEIAKCEVRCANCHRRKTAERHGGWIKTRVARARVELANTKV